MKPVARLEFLGLALLELFGCQMPLRSKGTLVAEIGMTFDEVKRRSTFEIKEPYRMSDGTYRDTDDVVFDYRIGDSSVVFPVCRYHWLVTRKSDPQRLAEINIGISPRKMPHAELETF